MVIIFYDSDKEQVYICTERDKMKIVKLGDEDLMSHIPNDDILYVQNAHCITKSQFKDWLSGDMVLQGESQDTHRFTGFMEDGVRAEHQTPISDQMKQTMSKYANSKWIHPAHQGCIIIEDIKTTQYPDGVRLDGKWDFLPVDSVGGFDALEESHQYRYLLGKGKIEVVDYEYVKKNQGKKKIVSASDAALDAILIKQGSAESVAAAGGIAAAATDYDGAIEILVE